MAKKSDEIREFHEGVESPAGVEGGESPVAAATAEPAAPTADPSAPPSAESTVPIEREFDVTLKNNETGTTQTLVARGTDPGLAAQAAMRQHPGWTAEHEKTHPHEG
jgi:hypothetical protein